MVRACAMVLVLVGCGDAAPTPTTTSADQRAARYRDCWARVEAGCVAVDDAARALAAGDPGARTAAELVLVNGREVAGIVRVRGPAGDRVVFHRAELEPGDAAAREWWLIADDERPGAAATAVAHHDDRELFNADAHRRLALLFSEEDPAALDRLADTVPGRAALVDDVRAAWSALEGARIEIARSWGAGDYTVLTGQLRGTAGSYRGQRRVIDLAFAHVLAWQGGAAVASHVFFDRRELAQQLDVATALSAR